MKVFKNAETGEIIVMTQRMRLALANPNDWVRAGETCDSSIKNADLLGKVMSRAAYEALGYKVV